MHDTHALLLMLDLSSLVGFKMPLSGVYMSLGLLMNELARCLMEYLYIVVLTLSCRCTGLSCFPFLYDFCQTLVKGNRKGGPNSTYEQLLRFKHVLQPEVIIISIPVYYLCTTVKEFL